MLISILHISLDSDTVVHLSLSATTTYRCPVRLVRRRRLSVGRESGLPHDPYFRNVKIATVRGRGRSGV